MKRPVKRICHLIFGLRISGKEQTDLGNRKWQRMAREMEEAKKMNLKKISILQPSNFKKLYWVERLHSEIYQMLPGINFTFIVSLPEKPSRFLLNCTL